MVCEGWYKTWGTVGLSKTPAVPAVKETSAILAFKSCDVDTLYVGQIVKSGFFHGADFP